MKKKKSIANTIWTVILTIAALAWVYPIIMILMNSLKKESAISTGTAFKLPTADAFAGIANYVDAIASKRIFKQSWIQYIYYAYFCGCYPCMLFNVCMVYHPCK